MALKRFILFILITLLPLPALAEDAFFVRPIADALRQKMTGVSYPATGEEAQISFDELAYIHVLHYDFDGQIRDGHLICNKRIADKIAAVFRELFEHAYPIEKIRLIDDYNGDDDASMADNNTSCFNYRKIAGSTKLSNHSFGLAIDFNPLYNPYVKVKPDKTVVSPKSALPYADRTKAFAHKIDKDDLAYRVFTKHGFIWGGNWQSVKDYQHFEYR